MQDVNVVISFYSRTGTTEKLALAAALGAVNGRGNIRLRRLPEIADSDAISADPGWKEACERMDKEYVSPREADALWADLLIIGSPTAIDISSPEMRAYVEWLAPLGSQGKLDGKLGLGFTSSIAGKKNESALAPLNGFMAEVGLIVIPCGRIHAESGTTSTEGIQARARHATEIARAIKPTRSRF